MLPFPAKAASFNSINSIMTLSPATTDPAAALRRAAALSERLQSSDSFRECEQIVRTLTGLHLCLESTDSSDVSPFYGVSSLHTVLEQHGDWMAKARQNLSQHRLPAAQIEQQHATSVGGLHEAAVTLRIGTERVGVLRIGQTLTSQATADMVADFARAWFGTEHLPDEIRLAIMRLPVMSQERWRSAVWLLHRVAGHLSSEGLRVVAVSGGMDPEPVARAREFIGQHFLEGDLSLPQIATAVGVTPNYLSHVYRKHTSLSVTESVNRLRIEHALKLLNQGGCRVSEVARVCGFGSLSQFNRSFRRYVGSSPSTYKSQGVRT